MLAQFNLFNLSINFCHSIQMHCWIASDSTAENHCCSMGKNTSSVIVMVPITARDCEERALRDIMPALGYVARIAFLRVCTKIMSLGGGCSPRYHARTWVRGNLLDGRERCACHTRKKRSFAQRPDVLRELHLHPLLSFRSGDSAQPLPNQYTFLQNDGSVEKDSASWREKFAWA